MLFGIHLIKAQEMCEQLWILVYLYNELSV